MAEQGHVHFVQSLEPLWGGGLGAAALQLHGAMRQAGLESLLLTTRDSSFCEEWDGAVQCSRSGVSKFFYARSLGQEARSVVSAGKVIHGHGFYVYPNWLLGRLARKQQLPLVYHPHGMFEPWILRRSRWKKALAHWLFEDANFRHVQLWRALTGREADQVRSVVGARVQIVVAPNGINLAPVKKATFARASGRKRALFLARLHPKKGLNLLLQAWAALGDLVKNWELVVAGPDEGGHEAEVRQWVQEMGLEQAVSFTGPVSGEAKYTLIASADLFVLTSYSEGLPMAPLEAMAAGVPVLVTEPCNLPEVRDYGAGWTTTTELASVQRELALALNADDQELRQRGSAGRQLVESKFSWQNTVAILHDACQQN